MCQGTDAFEFDFDDSNRLRCIWDILTAFFGLGAMALFIYYVSETQRALMAHDLYTYTQCPVHSTVWLLAPLQLLVNETTSTPCYYYHGHPLEVELGAPPQADRWLLGAAALCLLGGGVAQWFRARVY